MSYLGEFNIGDYINFFANTHNTSSGAAADAAAAPTFRVYDGVNSQVIYASSMVLLDENNTTGFYAASLGLTANSFTVNGMFAVYKEATVSSILGTEADVFRVTGAFSSLDTHMSSLDVRVSSIAVETDSVEARVTSLQALSATLATAAALTTVDNEVSSIQAIGNSIAARTNSIEALTATLATAAALTTVDNELSSVQAITNSIEARVSSTFQVVGTLATATALTTVDNEISSIQAIANSISAQTSSIDIRVSSVAIQVGSVDVRVSSIAAGTGATAAEVNAEVRSAMAVIHLDHLLAVDYDPATPPGVATALFNELIESNGGVSRYTAGALANAPGGAGISSVYAQVQSNFGVLGTVALASALTTVDNEISSIQAITNSIEARASSIFQVAGTLATAAAVTTVDDEISSLQASINTADAVADLSWARVQNLPNSGTLTDLATGAAVSSLDVRVSSADIRVASLDTRVASVAVQVSSVHGNTTQLGFGKSGQVDANIVSVTSKTITWNATSGQWGTS